LLGLAITADAVIGGIDLVVLDLATFEQRAISVCLDKSSKED
jgi:hypothetical protein